MHNMKLCLLSASTPSSHDYLWTYWKHLKDYPSLHLQTKSSTSWLLSNFFTKTKEQYSYNEIKTVSVFWFW